MVKKDVKKTILILVVIIILGFSPYIILNYGNKDDQKSSEINYYDSLVLSENYLINSVKEDGSFVYEYDALNDTESTDYNILRHAGTTYAMLQLYNVTKNEELLEQAQKAINFLISHKKRFLDDIYVIVYDDEIKLGGNGLSILALSEYIKVTGQNKYLIEIQQLARFINYSQKESGEFISKRQYSTGLIYDFVSRYYPGEALLGLCRLYSIDKNEYWLDIAEKGAKYLINIRDAGIETNYLTHDHWLMMALNELYRYRPNQTYYNHTLRIAESIINLQRDNINRETEQDEWLGSYYTPPGSTSTACRTEGLIAAYHLANDYGDNQMAEKILNAIDLGIEFQMKNQLTTQKVKNLPNPTQALGGFTGSLENYEIRNDYVQHNTCSILGFYKILN
jgi:hypothetical protein